MSSRSRRSSIALAAALAFGASGAGAVGFGASQLATQLGGPLDFSVVVLLDPGETIPRECINAEVTAGDVKLSGNQVLVLVQAGRSERQAIVRVGTAVGINEPIVSIEVTLGCTTPVSRKFVHLVDPAPIGTPSVMPGAVSDPSATGRRDAADPARRPRRAAPPASAPRRNAPTSTAPKERQEREAQRAERTALASLATTAAAATPAIVPARRALPASWARLFALLPIASAEAANVPARSSQAPAPPSDRATAAPSAVAAAEAARLAELEAGLAQLRDNARATQQSVATLQARLREEESKRYANPVVYGLTAIALAASVAAIAALRRKDIAGRPHPALQDPAVAGAAALPRGDRPDGSAARAAAPAAQATPRTNASSYTNDESVDDAEADDPAARDPAATSSDADDRTALVRSVPPTIAETSTIGGLEVTTMLAPVPIGRGREAANGAAPGDASAGAASAVEALLDLEQQVEFFTVLGQDAAAIDLLAAYVDEAGAGASPLPYLGLLQMQARRDDAASFERTRALYEHRFGVTAPEWGTDLDGGPGLEAHRAVLARLQALWRTPLQALPVLARLLFHDSDGAPLFDHASYRELLFLYGMARELAEHVETDFGAIDLFLPLEDSGPPSTIVDVLPTVPGTVDLDLSEWPDDDPAELLQIVRSPGRRGAA